MAEQAEVSNLSHLTASEKLMISLVGFASESEALDPIRIMKGLFIVCMKSPKEYFGGGLPYEFQPYLYGPYSGKVYDDLARLEELKLIFKRLVPGQSWARYYPTPEGKKTAAMAIARYDDRLGNYIGSVYRYVQGKDFASLLNEVYKAFPDYAVNSVFQSQY
jgi:hypothetical protein